MKRLTALMLALILCLGLFAACSGKKDPANKPDTPDGPSVDTPDTPSTPDTPTTPDVPEDTKKQMVLDATDGLTIAIKNRGESSINDRVGIQAEKGTVQLATYHKSGALRQNVTTFQWADLGLEGQPWEYLGSVFEVELADPANPVILSKPTQKSAFVYEGRARIPFEGDNQIKLPIGTFDIPGKLQHCGFNGQNLICEGGQFLPKWGDKFYDGRYSAKWNENGARIWSMFVTCELYDSIGYVAIDNEPSTYSASYVAPDPSTMTKVFGFSGFMFGAHNVLGSLELMLEEGLQKDVFKTVKYLGHTSNSSTWNIHEMFTEEAQGDPENMAFSSGGEEMAGWLSTNTYDYVVLQVGRDLNLMEGDMRGIYSATKIASLAAASSPKAKIVIVAPYGHTATWPDTPQITSHKDHVALINEQAKKTVDAIKAAGVENEVVMVSVGDVFEAYAAGGGNLSDLFQDNNSVDSRGNTANRASIKGAYLTACTLYAAMTGKSPVGLTTLGDLDISTGIDCSVSAADAAALQALAASVVLK